MKDEIFTLGYSELLSGKAGDLIRNVDNYKKACEGYLETIRSVNAIQNDKQPFIVHTHQVSFTSSEEHLDLAYRANLYGQLQDWIEKEEESGFIYSHYTTEVIVEPEPWEAWDNEHLLFNIWGFYAGEQKDLTKSELYVALVEQAKRQLDNEVMYYKEKLGL